LAVSSFIPKPSGIAGSSVLLSDEHYKHSLGIVRHLGRMGALVSVVAGSRGSLACCSRYCRRVILSPAPSLEALVDTIVQAVQREHFDLVMPVSFPMTLALAKRRAELVPHTHLELVKSHAIERAADKLQIMQLAEQVGVPVPKTIIASQITEHRSELRFPVVVKLRKECPGHAPVRYANNLSQLERILAGTPAGSPRSADSYLVQEFIPGEGCGFFATYQNGFCKRIFMHRRIREYPATGGVSSCAESFYDASLEWHGRRMLDALNWHGVAMVEFRRDSRDATYKLMEINPKFWGSLDLALAASADFPGDLCRMALGEALTFTDNYQRNLRFHWPFSGSGDLFHLWRRPKSFLPMALDFLDPRVKSNVWLHDPYPNLQEVSGLAGKLLPRGKG
jgi:predicted ATP-grasp superfamily ATP-dependent carboligase